ncbi:TetR/AcrR family transcriptional regulator [Marinilactibacillus sp. XAAS-LB27]|uniref:TetR/AcrR family transcriptional regulator n=1 Tax=Marinilactibacillus sp. XAAS-LB27 TaxID=3114538 RepID=UPI002E195D02|nr:TetR/AcrR family transcriptional regulator [Marinilactibacillus sp. XAAS-LB27]
MKRTKKVTDQTIQQLIDIAARLFSENGYHDVSLEEIVQTAQLTRGAVYHHFKNKKGLFYAVFEQTHERVAEEINKVDEEIQNPWEQLIQGCLLFVQTVSKETFYRILLIDGPAVLGWQTFRELDQKHSMRLLQEQIEYLQKNGTIKKTSSAALTSALSGAINDLSLWVAEQKDKEEATKEAENIINGILNGFRK